MSGPSSIGRYPVIRRLGSGAFATVWLGHDPQFDVDVAIKVLADNWAADAGIRERFTAEARFLRRIRDRRVVHVYDIGTLEDGRPYFVMDYLDAGSLEDLRLSRVAPDEALRLCAEAARGLDVLHRHHLVHRDVTPGNLLLASRPDGSWAVVVADLGVARSIVDSSAGAMIVGTPSYMAPEQAGSGAVDHRADLYALCAVAYALLTGHPPFPVERVADLATRGAEVRPPPLAAALGAPATLDGLLVSGLATDPHRRPPTAALLADALERVAEDLARVRAAAVSTAQAVPHAPGTISPVAPVPAPATPAPPGRPGRSSAFYIAMTALAVVVFAVFVAVVVGSSL
ncbi:MAG TPA: serine/threonine-protein kinase [Microlunatus sp.]|nr:serine/threonine-protein kinase [Microlunatus sp.]